jgi:hypothetical protein
MPIMEPGVVFYVLSTETDGDAHPGAGTFRTLEAARDAIRRLKAERGLPTGGVHVVLMAGRHHRTETFVLQRQDSGTLEKPIVYRAESGERVIISGGTPLDTQQFQLVRHLELLARLHPQARGRVVSLDLSGPDLRQHFPGHGDYGLISMGGHLLQLAQWPNRGYHHIGDFIDRGPTTRWLKPGEEPTPYSMANPTGGKFACNESLPPQVEAEFRRTGDITVEGYLSNDWYFQREPIGRISGEVIQLLRHTRYGIEDHIPGMPRRVRLVNILAELDEPGEWYFDRQTERLFVWPIEGFAPGSSSVTVLGGAPLLGMKDTEAITFRDLIFENAGKLAIDIQGGHHNLVAGCTIRNGLGRGISISGGRYNGLTGCDLHGLGQLFSLSGGDIKSVIPCYNFATNNEMHDCRHRGYGIAGLNGVGLRFANNLLYNLNGGISFRTVNLLVEYNEFYDIGYEMGDFNPMYCGALWYTMNNVQRFNFVHHLIERGGYPVGAFRNDDGGAGLNIYGNVFYRAGRYACGFSGPANSFQNNIALDMSVMWWTVKAATTPEEIQARWDDLARFGRDLPHGDKGDYLYQVEQILGPDGWRQDPWKSAFPIMDQFIRTNPWAQSFCRIDRNYYHKIRELAHVHGGKSDMAEETTEGRLSDLPAGCTYVSPVPIDLDVFAEWETLDFRFKPSFTPMPGFEPIPFDRIGLYRDAYRDFVPDKTAYRRAVYLKYRNDRARRYDPQTVSQRYPLPTYLRQ